MEERRGAGPTLLVVTLAAWFVLATSMLVVLPTVGRRYEFDIGCDTHYVSLLEWAAASLLLGALLALNLVATFRAGSSGIGRKLQITSLVLSLPVVWWWCTALLDFTWRPCAN